MLLLALLPLAIAQSTPAPDTPAPAPPPDDVGESEFVTTWPAPGSLKPPVRGPLQLPAASARPLRVALDPGHGVKGEDGAMANPGMDTADCTSEATFTLDVARDLARRLEDTGRFEVFLLRDEPMGPPYADRWAMAEARQADVLLSIHADSRGVNETVEVGGRPCPQRAEDPGFTVLFSMEGDDAMDARRGGLARALSAELRGRGFPTYDGAWYGDRYQRDEVDGVFIDGRGLAMLRRPPMPSVIIETHHAWHPEEWARWQEEETREAFAYAVFMGLMAWQRRHPPAADTPSTAP